MASSSSGLPAALNRINLQQEAFRANAVSAMSSVSNKQEVVNVLGAQLLGPRPEAVDQRNRAMLALWQKTAEMLFTDMLDINAPEGAAYIVALKDAVHVKLFDDGTGRPLPIRPRGATVAAAMAIDVLRGSSPDGLSTAARFEALGDGETRGTFLFVNQRQANDMAAAALREATQVPTSRSSLDSLA